jgi:hypothetical protein
LLLVFQTIALQKFGEFWRSGTSCLVFFKLEQLKSLEKNWNFF